MSLIRILSVLLIVLSTSLSGTMSTARVANADVDIMAGDTQAGASADCCDTDTDRPMDCYFPTAIFPFAGRASSDAATAWTTIIPRGLTLSGVEPRGLLDPPRSV